MTTYLEHSNEACDREFLSSEEKAPANEINQTSYYSPFAVFKRTIQFILKVNKSFYYVMKMGIRLPIFISLIPIYGPLYILYCIGFRFKILSKLKDPLNALCADISSLITIWSSSRDKKPTQNLTNPSTTNAAKFGYVSQSYNNPPRWAVCLIYSSLVIGIFSLLIAYIPFIGSYASSPGSIGGILSCVSVLIYRKTRFRLAVCIVSLCISVWAIYIAQTNTNETLTAINNTKTEIKKRIGDTVQSVKDTTESVLNDTVQTFENAAPSVKNTAKSVKDTAESVLDDTVQTFENAAPSINNAANSLLKMFN